MKPTGNPPLSMKAPDDYADLLASDPTRSYTAPAAKHGVSHLMMGLFFGPLLLAILNSCAGPARLPERPVVRHAEHDSRTKLVEPTPPRLK
jgi:hypothetical protein